MDFPLDDLDLSSYISYKNGQTTYRYMLYAISNHYGSMGGGHYTAYVHVSEKRHLLLSSYISCLNGSSFLNVCVAKLWSPCRVGY